MLDELGEDVLTFKLEPEGVGEGRRHLFGAVQGDEPDRVNSAWERLFALQRPHNLGGQPRLAHARQPCDGDEAGLAAQEVRDLAYLRAPPDEACRVGWQVGAVTCRAELTPRLRFIYL